MSKSTATETGAFACSYGCGRRFDKKQAQLMHEVRMHTHKSVADNAGRNQHHNRSAKVEPPRTAYRFDDQSREAQLARKRIYNAKYRARKRKGLPLAPKWSNDRTSDPVKIEKRRYYLKQKARYNALGLNAKGKPWKIGPQARRNVQLAQAKRRRRERLEGLMAPVSDQAILKAARATAKKKPAIKKRLHFVWPPPREERDFLPPHDNDAFRAADITAEMKPTGSTVGAVHFCPKCGEDITRWKRD